MRDKKIGMEGKGKGRRNKKGRRKNKKYYSLTIKDFMSVLLFTLTLHLINNF